MKLGIIGLPGSGKATVFEALTGNFSDRGPQGDARIGTVTVPDERLQVLSGIFKPKKTICARVEYHLPLRSVQKEPKGEQGLWAAVRDTDALIHVVRNFGGYDQAGPSPVDDFHKLNQEIILTDLFVVEKRLERLKVDQQRGKKIDPAERGLLESCQENLENENPLRRRPELATAPRLRGFGFVSAKPMLILFNNEDEDDRLPNGVGRDLQESCAVIRGKLEHELAQMSTEEAGAFLAEFNIAASARDRIIQQSYSLVGLISFFTFNQDEVKAWTAKRETAAVDAAELIHSDMKRGFIRAEVVAYDDLVSAGSYQEARKQGTVRLEGRSYPVQDGDIVTFRFNV